MSTQPKENKVGDEEAGSVKDVGVEVIKDESQQDGEEKAEAKNDVDNGEIHKSDLDTELSPAAVLEQMR